MKKAGLEFKVGVFVVASLAILTMLVAKTGDFYLKPGYGIRMVFDSVGGIETGSLVKLAGVGVGEVKDISVVRSAEGETQVEVHARIDQGVYLEEDARPRVDSVGFLGEKYIEIVPGTSGNKAIGAGGVLVGHEASNMDDVMASGKRLIGKMDQAIDHVNQIVGDPEFKTHVKGTFTNADKVATNLVQTTDDLKDAAGSAKIVMARLRDGEGTVGKLLKEDKVAKDLEAFVADIKAHPWKLLKRN